jgi:hypothetical protein
VTIKGIYPGSASAPEASSGIFFREQSVDSLVSAIRAFEEVEHRFSPFFIKQEAERFGPGHFREGFCSFLAEKWDEFHASL